MAIRSWLDFLRSDVREWYQDQFSLENYKGSSDILHVWNDMNEASLRMLDT
jgi:alpha-glucosidase (family GH31 glycosyl hydrolase)